ncbi:nitrite reductase large subunit NirB [Pseudoalteromonas sp. MMG010]|uniref:nitrite reductase large subunit NirB n=1 Tax=Pseudoalteromonas sp. MMG010 TaxID=2822685 RepID=UPI001B3A3991|nr:nitrite reductase large subunit NirB [Pseudoalteromonas sp. MMG010]MBQ4832547.1 nitrite reductase large subunit NirB [Pseudoalteromonas sp. MMG010]
MKASQKILVIGNGMVGHHFVEQMRQSDPQAEITVLCGEANLAYDRVYLSSFFDGKTVDDLALTTLENYNSLNINVHTKQWVENINRQEKLVITKEGNEYGYDKLVLATGSYPFVPPIPGNDQAHCLVYRTIEDLEQIHSSAQSSTVGVVIGGGLLGLEAANALKQIGLHTHVVEFAPQLMAVQLDEQGGTLLRNKIEKLGVSVHTAKATTEIVAGETLRYRLNFSDDTFLETDIVLFSAGIRPYDQLGKVADLTLGERGGIVINDQCQTSDESIYAIGECALWDKKLFGLVAPGYNMARVAASHLIGGDLSFSGADMSTKLKLLGVEVGSIGDAHARSEQCKELIYQDPIRDCYKKIVLNESGSKLLGAVLVGDTSDYDTLLQYMLNDMDLPENPECLILPSTGEAPALAGNALPDTATICSCHNVSKGDIVSAIDAGACDLGDVKTCTKAASGCGGCAALLKSVVDSELESRGVEVNNHVCEHFAFSRQELMHLVKVDSIKTFDELLSKHGQGKGCELCKPAIASILASTWNEFVLDTPHVGLQDTNDTFLANMQKDGSYSVVPRVPAGEITPEGLIVIGQIAKDFNLYCKITGGQRIDLFGARLEQLPVIWKRLIDAGFETGHAYGKSLRTVKSCVGSTWCRYGVQDSVGQAIAIENRYKGLRTPHKFKLAVSGCTRECAEAQSKDIGIIATENGWNLYVCGNGGMRPRHADLFATDIDTQTLITYIDRVLMFYAKTADKLQRTSVWMENLEGGLDYLKSVVIDDSLGICAELDAQMNLIVDTYECEWKKTIESPEAVKRFRQFVNSPEEDTNILFVQERNQIRPATESEKKAHKHGDENRIPVVEINQEKSNVLA